MKKCPFCGEEIQNEAIKCRYCKEFFSDNKFPATDNRNEIQEVTAISTENKCPKCNFKRIEGDEECPCCGVIYKKAIRKESLDQKQVSDTRKKRTYNPISKELLIRQLPFSTWYGNIGILPGHFKKAINQSNFSKEKIYLCVPGKEKAIVFLESCLIFLQTEQTFWRKETKPILSYPYDGLNKIGILKNEQSSKKYIAITLEDGSVKYLIQIGFIKEKQFYNCIKILNFLISGEMPEKKSIVKLATKKDHALGFLGGGCFGIFFGLGFIALGGLLSIFGITAIIGIPMILIGIAMLFVGPFAGLLEIGKGSITSTCPFCGDIVSSEMTKKNFKCPTCEKLIVIRNKEFVKID